MYILKCNHQEIEKRGVTIEHTPSDERLISPVTVRQLMAFLSQFEHGVIIHAPQAPNENFVIEVVPCPNL